MADTETGLTEDNTDHSSLGSPAEARASTSAAEPSIDAPMERREDVQPPEEHGMPTADLEPAKPLRLDSDRDLSRAGFWTLSLGALGVCVAVVFFMIGGILPGALVMVLALIIATVGAMTLALVAHHQG